MTTNIILLFGAGHETTVNLIGNGLLALTAIPTIKANPSLITNAIEEFLRYDSSVQMTGRVALRTSRVSAECASRRARTCSACSARRTAIRLSGPA